MRNVERRVISWETKRPYQTFGFYRASEFTRRYRGPARRVGAAVDDDKDQQQDTS